jgi:hypothetical protein
MNRTDLLRQLRAHKPFDAREGEMLERITDFVRDNETCCDRNLKAGHLTGSAWIIDRDRTHALESKALQWVALDEITEVTGEESVLRMVRKISATEMSSR